MGPLYEVNWTGRSARFATTFAELLGGLPRAGRDERMGPAG